MGAFHDISPPRFGRVPNRGRASHAGFTLVELLVTVAIAAVLMAVGVPAMTSFLSDQAAAANADEFAEALRFARSEAVKRGDSVSLCASTNLTACGEDWKAGWIVSTSSGKVLRVQNPIRAMGDLTAAATTVTFQSTGIATAGSGSYVFATLSGNTDRSRTVALNAQGRVVVSKGEGS